jgi:WD40 repeat protein
MPDDPHRRYLIAAGITTDLPKSGSRIIDSVNRMARVFTTDFGYERVTPLDIDPTSDEIRKFIREFCLKCGRSDVVALYYTGHADEVNETHRVWAGDTIDSVSSTLETRLLAELMLVGTPLRYALIILDTCFAGKGGAEALRAAVSSIGEGDGKTLGLLTAAYPREQIVAGDFARLFEHAVGRPGVAGHEPRYLTLGAITGLIDADPSRPGWQTVSHGLLGARTDLLPFFPNRRFNARLHGLDLLTQLRIEQQELRGSDIREHFLPRARGGDVPAESRWRFVGREAALRDLVSWLADEQDASARVVTGGPGSGKSAVIGRLVVLSDRDWRRSVPMDGLAPDTIPPEGSIAVGVHARSLTSVQVLEALCAAVGVRADTPADLLRQMRGRRVTMAVDAIDEALDPSGLVSGVLRPLVEAGPAEGLRLLLGTRRHLLDPLGLTASAVDLDDEHYADPASLYEYVLRCLETDEPGSPYHSAPEELTAAVARAVAAAADYSFLVALIVSRTLLSVAEPPDPDDPGWRDSLPRNAADAMHSDLEIRLGADAGRARDLLRPLAFAHGAGLPWEDLWAPLASLLSGRDYGDEDLVWLRRQAGSYVVEAMESGRSVYRLYHAALVEYLRQDSDEEHFHRLFSRFLVGRVPAARAGPDWSRAHPYTLAHLATHAQRTGMLDDLLLDPGYLVSAVPAGLLAALPAARDPDAQLAGRAYQRAVHHLRGRSEDDRLSYLELASQISRAAELTSRITTMAPHRRWSVRWTHWPPEHPHRILDGNLGQLNGVACADPGDGSPVVASIGQDARLRIWDLVTAEPRGAYTVGDAPLTAVRAAELPGGRTVLVLLAADGLLHTWDLATAALLKSVPVLPRWRWMARRRGADLALRCLADPDGQQFAVVSGRDVPASMWDLSTGRRVTVFPAGVNPGGVELVTLIDGRTVLATSTGSAAQWVRDLQTGQELPDEHRRIPFAWLRSLYDTARRSYLNYYAFPDGAPVVAVRFYRKTAVFWDLTQSDPLGSYRRRGGGVQMSARVSFTDGRTATVGLPPAPPSNIRNIWNFWKTVGRPQLPRQEPTPPQADDGLILLGSPPLDLGRPGPRFEMIGRFIRVELPGRTPLTLAGHAADLTGYDWTRLPDGHLVVVTTSQDGTVRRWDISAIDASSGAQDEPARIALHRIVSAPLEDGTLLGLTVADGPDVALWDLRSGEPVGGLRDRLVRPCVLGIARPAGRAPVAVTFDMDQAMRLWDLPGGHQVAQFPAGRDRWPADVACARLSDGTCVAVTSGHGRKAVVWDLGTGRIRHVLVGHRGWTAGVTCAEDARRRPIALTAGLDNRVNMWDLGRGHRRGRFRIVSPWTFLTRPASGRALAVRARPLGDGTILVLVTTSDGTVRALRSRQSSWGLWGARRTGAVPADVAGLATLGDDEVVVVTATGDGVVRVWRHAALARPADDRVPLCEINLEVPVEDIAAVDLDTFVVATVNGLTAIRIDASSLRHTEPVLS